MMHAVLTVAACVVAFNQDWRWLAWLWLTYILIRVLHALRPGS